MATKDLEFPACPLCGAQEAFTAHEFPPYRVVRCRACRFHSLSPRPTERAMVARYARDDYYEGSDVGYTSYSEQAVSLRVTFRALMATLRRRGLTGGALLEVGCGHGYLLEAAQGYFHPRMGTEYARGAAREAVGRADHVWAGNLDALPPDARFDCIVSSQVIEHVYDPRGFLRKQAEHLLPGGYIVAATPDIGGGLYRLMRQRWPSFKIPEHIQYFDRHSLGRLMAEAGLVRVRRLPFPHAFPLSLIARKLGFPAPAWLGRLMVFVPATTVACVGHKPV